MKHETVSGAREFWITLHHNEFDVLVPLHAFYSREKAFDERAKSTIHVIEYSAYQKLQSCLDKAVLALEFYADMKRQDPKYGPVGQECFDNSYQDIGTYAEYTLAAISNIMSEPKNQEKE